MHAPLKFAIAVIASVLGLAAFAQAPSPTHSPARIAEAVLGDLPGIASVGVLRDGKIELAVRRRSMAGMDMEAVDLTKQAEPIFEIGSVSKVFTGLLLARRVERGELRLDDSIGDLLKGTVAFRYESAGAIKLRHLLTHTACLKRWPAAFTRQGMFPQASEYTTAKLWSDLSTHVVGRTPPCETMYSNVGFAVLGQTLAERAKQPWESLVIAEITQPLAMHDTRVQLSRSQQERLAPPWRGALRSKPWDTNAFAPAGGLRSTATDLLAFSRALMQGRGGPFGPAAERLVTDLTSFGENGMRIGYGVLLPQGAERVWMHGGETQAYNTEWIVWPDRKEAVVILVSNLASPTRAVRTALVDGTFSGKVPEEVVYTRGEFRGVFEEDGGRRSYARVKLAPGQKIPFSTLTFRVLDRQLVKGLKEGAQVEFRAERIDGENTITAVRLPAR